MRQAEGESRSGRRKSARLMMLTEFSPWVAANGSWGGGKGGNVSRGEAEKIFVKSVAGL